MAEKTPLKFSRTAPTEAQFRRILQTQPADVTAELAAAAMDLLRDEERNFDSANRASISSPSSSAWR